MAYGDDDDGEADDGDNDGDLRREEEMVSWFSCGQLVDDDDDDDDVECNKGKEDVNWRMVRMVLAMVMDGDMEVGVPWWCM